MLDRTRRPPSRLVVVAYRGPVSLGTEGGRTRYRRGDGGLVSALEPVLRSRGGLWVAAGEPPPGALPDIPFNVPGRGGLEVLHLPVPPTLHERAYLGFSNRVLWPLAHGFSGRIRFERREFRGYLQVNELFADAIVAQSRPEDAIWIHDYHFAALPALIRARAPDRKISFFWHIPFPPFEIFRVLPFHETLIAGMLGSDAIHFHLESYATCFRETAGDLLSPEGKTLDGRSVHIGAEPIGVDVAAWQQLGRDPEVRKGASLLRRQWGAAQIVLGLDRLDYTKGILERILAVEQLLERNPALRGTFSLVQIAIPSRTRVPEYRRLRREIEETVGRVNGRFSEGAYSPVHYYYRRLPPRGVAAHYRAADVALVTPLRDGMNLVCMEFMATNFDRSPVLVLSELAGASHELAEALPVNPRDLEGLMEGIQVALEMPEAERRSRAERLRARIEALDVHGWAERILARLLQRPGGAVPDEEEGPSEADPARAETLW
jgi:alpha,alpha-trehalose-phosphate synthase [UDP-forming]